MTVFYYFLGFQTGACIEAVWQSADEGMGAVALLHCCKSSMCFSPYALEEHRGS